MFKKSPRNYIVKFCILLLLPVSARLQSRPFFTISSTGTFSSGAVSNSQPYSFNNSNDCLFVKSGLSLNMGKNGTQKFVMSCTFKNNNDDVVIKLYPNPLSSRGQLISASMLGNEPKLRISIVDNSGKIMMSFQHTSLQLVGGIEINAQKLTTGNYFLKIDGIRFHRVIQFLKLN